jgi:uncharacterized membrane protein YkvA (DUF1232 family)
MDKVLEGELLGPADEPAGAERIRQRFFKTLRKAARTIPFTDELVAAFYCALDPATPVKVRGTLLAAFAYFVVPFDAIPDFLAGFGFTDDASVLLMAIGMVRAHITPVHREAARRALLDPNSDK